MFPWLTIDEARPGIKIRCDGGFTCVPPDSVHTLHQQADGDLYFNCACGHHAIEGQADDNPFYIGLYRA